MKTRPRSQEVGKVNQRIDFRETVMHISGPSGGGNRGSSTAAAAATTTICSSSSSSSSSSNR